jgi:hypothetical protein
LYFITSACQVNLYLNSTLVTSKLGDIYSNFRCYAVQEITMKYHFVVKANESIFPRSPQKNSDSRFGIKDGKREKYPPGLQERKSLVQKQARATTN